jgi:hypothetical protein
VIDGTSPPDSPEQSPLAAPDAIRTIIDAMLIVRATPSPPAPLAVTVTPAVAPIVEPPTSAGRGTSGANVGGTGVAVRSTTSGGGSGARVAAVYAVGSTVAGGAAVVGATDTLVVVVVAIGTTVVGVLWADDVVVDGVALDVRALVLVMTVVVVITQGVYVGSASGVAAVPVGKRVSITVWDISSPLRSYTMQVHTRSVSSGPAKDGKKAAGTDRIGGTIDAAPRESVQDGRSDTRLTT